MTTRNRSRTRSGNVFRIVLCVFGAMAVVLAFMLPIASNFSTTHTQPVQRRSMNQAFQRLDPITVAAAPPTGQVQNDWVSQPANRAFIVPTKANPQNAAQKQFGNVPPQQNPAAGGFSSFSYPSPVQSFPVQHTGTFAMAGRAFGQPGPPHLAGAPVDPRVVKLSSELGGLANDDEQRGPKLEQLKELLEAEFSERHAQQAKRITEASNRVGLLKQTHEERARRKDEIIERRIEALIGQPDVLQWVPRASITAPTTYPNRSIGVSAVQPNPTPVPMRDLPSASPNAFGALSPVVPQKPKNTVLSTNNRNQPSEPQSNYSALPTTRVEVSAATSSDVFAVARQLSSALADVSASKKRFDILENLLKENTASESEYLDAESKYELARRELFLARAEMNATARGLQRDMSYADSRVEKASSLRDMVKSRVENGTVSTKELLEQELIVAAAEKYRADTHAKYEQLKNVGQLLMSGDSADSEDPFGRPLNEPNTPNGVEPAGEEEVTSPDEDAPFS